MGTVQIEKELACLEALIHHGAATARAGACRASVAMIAQGNRPILRGHGIDIPEIQPLPSGVFPLEMKHLIEITIIDLSFPADADRVTAHEPLDRSRIKGVGEEFQVALEEPFRRSQEANLETGRLVSA